MSELRSKLIRLAYQRPELRDRLLPLLKEAGSQKPDKPKPGDVWQTENGKFRAVGPKGETKSFNKRDDAEHYANPDTVKGMKEQHSLADEDVEDVLGEVARRLERAVSPKKSRGTGKKKGPGSRDLPDDIFSNPDRIKEEVMGLVDGLEEHGEGVKALRTTMKKMPAKDMAKMIRHLRRKK